MKNVTLNAQGHEVPSIATILGEKDLRLQITETLQNIFTKLSISGKESDLRAAIYFLLEYAELEGYFWNYRQYESLAHKTLTPLLDVSKITEELENRAARIYQQISRHVLNCKTAIDIGCGNGRVAELLDSQGIETTLADVYLHQNIKANFLKIKDHEISAPDNTYDLALLLTVLHHANNPILTLDEARRVTKPGGKIIVIESVYGIKNQPEDWKLDDEQKIATQRFKQLSPEQQRQFNIFFDHFYNRIIYYSKNPENKVNVPFNFNTPEEWNRIFSEAGLKQNTLSYLGIDHPIVPEYHTLHVIEKMK